MSEITFDQATKAKWVNAMQEHQDMDRLVQGSWLQDPQSSQKIHKGCFFGCAMQTENNPLDAAIKEMNLPEWLVYLAERIFEGLPKGKAIKFPVKLLSSIPVDTCIERVRHDLAIKRLSRLINENNGNDVNSSIKLVIEYHKNPSEQLRESAESAYSAAWSAESAVRSAAESAAWTQECDDLIELLSSTK